MLKAHFGFQRLPFQQLDSNQAIYESASVAYLKQRFSGFMETKGIMLLVGESGAGKTTSSNYLVNHLLDTHRFHAFYFANYPPASKGFLRLLIAALGFQPKFYVEDILTQLPQVLNDYHAQTRLFPFLIFDEAQNISPNVLEEIRLITCLPHQNQPLMAFLAHSGFKDKLKLTCFQPLRSRISLIFQIDPLSKTEIKDYILFHLKFAGLSKSVFSDDAITAIFNASRGNPRLINTIAFESLNQAAFKNLSEVNQDLVDLVASLLVA